MWLDMGGPAAGDVADGFQQLLGGAGFDEITVGAGFQGHEDALAVLIDGDHDDLQIGRRFAQLDHTIDAGHARQLDVHEDDVGMP
jgi:hypothetical protein